MLPREPAVVLSLEMSKVRLDGLEMTWDQWKVSLPVGDVRLSSLSPGRGF